MRKRHRCLQSTGSPGASEKCCLPRGDKTTENQITKDIIFNEVDDLIEAPEGRQIKDGAAIDASGKHIKQ
jgi:hypothetical protein